MNGIGCIFYEADISHFKETMLETVNEGVYEKNPDQKLDLGKKQIPFIQEGSFIWEVVTFLLMFITTEFTISVNKKALEKS